MTNLGVFLLCRFRFNINIVECKYMFIRTVMKNEKGFNINIVECKYSFLDFS